MIGFLMNAAAALIFGLATGELAVAVPFIGAAAVCLMNRDTDTAESK